MKKNYAAPEVTKWDIEPAIVIAASTTRQNAIQINSSVQSSGHGAKAVDFSSTEFEDDLDF